MCMRNVALKISNIVGQIIAFKSPLVSIIILVVFHVITAVGLLLFPYEDADVIESFAPINSVVKKETPLYDAAFPAAKSLVFATNEALEAQSTIAMILEFEKNFLHVNVSNCSIVKLTEDSFTLTKFVESTGRKATVENASKTIYDLRDTNFSHLDPYIASSISPKLRGWTSTYQMHSLSQKCFHDFVRKSRDLEIHLEKKYDKKCLIFSSNDPKEEFLHATEDDLNYLICGYILVVIFLLFAVESYSCNVYQNKIIVGIFGAYCIGLSYYMGQALARMLGIKSGPLNNVLIVLLSGIGVDNIFVIVAKADDSSKKESNIVLVKTIELAGLAIFATTFTDCLSLGTGIFSFIFAIRSLCVYTVMSVLALFILATSCFSVALEIWRKNTINFKPNPTELNEDIFAYLLKRLLNIVLKSHFAKFIILLITSGQLALGLYGISNLSFEMTMKDMMTYLYLPSSNVPHYFTVSNDIFEKSFLLEMTIFYDKLNICDASNREKLTNLSESIAQLPLVDPKSVWFWGEYFNIYYPIVSNEDFLMKFQCWLGIIEIPMTTCGHGSRFRNDFPQNWQSTPTCVTEGIIRFSLKDHKNSTLTDLMSVITDLRNICQHSGLKTFPHEIFKGVISMIEFTSQIKYQFFKNMLVVLLLCSIAMILLNFSLTSLFAILSVLLSTTVSTGMIYFLGLKLEASTFIIMIMSVGFSIDYSTHVVFEFNESHNTKKTFKHICLPVCQGAFSTFLPFIPVLIFAQSYAFKTFARMFSMIVLVSVWHAIPFLTCVLYAYERLLHSKYLSKSTLSENSSKARKYNQFRDEGGIVNTTFNNINSGSEGTIEQLSDSTSFKNLVATGSIDKADSVSSETIMKNDHENKAN